MRNAFIRALVPKVDEKETVQKAEQKTEKKKISDAPVSEKAVEKRPLG